LDEPLTDLQTRLAFQEDALDAMGRRLAAQQAEIDELRRRLDGLAAMLRELSPAVADGDAGVPPPHY
jgi:SlyX protein